MGRQAPTTTAATMVVANMQFNLIKKSSCEYFSTYLFFIYQAKTSFSLLNSLFFTNYKDFIQNNYHSLSPSTLGSPIFHHNGGQSTVKLLQPR